MVSGTGQNTTFRDRADAGRRLAARLEPYVSDRTAVLAVPRGGVPVAAEVSLKLKVPLDIVVTRKIPMPQNPEAGYGAVAEDGTVFLNDPVLKRLALDRTQVENQVRTVHLEIERRSRLYRTRLKKVPLAGRTAVLIDDGLASGYTMVAAVASVKRQEAEKVIVASPVASASAYDLLSPNCDELVCLVVSGSYPFAVADYYRNWYDLTDDDILRSLRDWERSRETAG